jgi:CubicO group peptidase (beta-lactamase class C family)
MNKAYILFFLLILQVKVRSQELTYFKDSLQGKSFGIDRFAGNLDKELKDSSVGWAYSISQNGRVISQGHGGYKVTPIDRNDGIGIPFQTNTRIHVASLSKTITALAIAKLVELKKLNWDSEVRNYLPPSWKLHPAFSHLTIRTLLTMKSGLNGPLDQLSSGFDSLRSLLEKGPDSSKIGVFNYQNTSYGLLRIVIGYAVGFTGSPATNSRVISEVTATLYKQFVIDHILRPAGIDSVDCRIIDTDPALSYPFPYHDEHGDLTGDGDLSEYAGGFGWYLSLDDATKLINTVVSSNKILSGETLNQLIGVQYPFVIRKGKYGTYFGTGGDWGHPLKPSGWAGIHTYFVCFPDRLIAVVFTNSGEGSPSKRIIRAYYDAIN